MEKRYIGDPFEVEITPEDMKDATFDHIRNCPLAKASIRLFKSQEVQVLSNIVRGPNKTLFEIISSSFNTDFPKGGFSRLDFNQVQLKLIEDPTYIHKVTLQQYISIGDM